MVNEKSLGLTESSLEQLQADLLAAFPPAIESDSELENGTPESEIISMRLALHDAGRFAAPFVLSRLMTALQNLGNGIVINNLNIPDAIAAAPVMFMVQMGIVGTSRGALSSVNAVIGSLNGEMKYEKIGPAVNQGLLMAVVLGIPTTAAFYTAGNWLQFCGMESALAQQAGEYLKTTSYGIIPTYMAVVDQAFLLSIKRTRAPLLLNTLLVSTAMIVGYPLVFREKSLAWLGYALSASALMTFVLGRMFLYNNKVDGKLDREKFNLFSRSFDSGTAFKDLIGLSIPTALQAISEWLPTMLIAIISASGIDAENNLDAQEPSMQTLVILNQVLLALGTAATVSVANALGRARAYEDSESYAKVWKNNARTIGYANIMMTSLITLSPALFCAIYPDPIVKLFSDNDKVFPLAKNLLRITGGSLIIDGIRNTATGALLGKKQRSDNYYTSITNLAITSAAAVTLGYFTEDAMGPMSYFVFRLIAMTITASLLLQRWHMSMKPESESEISPFIYRNTIARAHTFYGSNFDAADVALMLDNEALITSASPRMNARSN